MRSSERLARLVLATTLLVGSPAHAQKHSTGFALERFVPSAPGAGWLALDDLAIPRHLTGVISIGGTYAHDPWRIDTPGGTVPVVAHEATASISGSVSYERLRLSFGLQNPLLVTGHNAFVHGRPYLAPTFDLAKSPDTLADTRFGLDARILGSEASRFRLGAGVQLFVPSGDRADYLSDSTYRAVGRVLVAGDVGIVTYAAHVGVHVRPRFEGSELLFGAAAGLRLLARPRGVSLVLGPEVFGETALHSFFGRETTGVEALLSSRLEGPSTEHVRLRFKLGSGGGLHDHFGAPDFRVVTALELLATP